MEGETTLDEERLLGDWLRTHEGDDSLKPYRRMFAAFDAGLPLPAAPPRERGGEMPKRARRARWRQVAAAVVAALLALGGIWLAKRPTISADKPPVAERKSPKPVVATPIENDDMRPALAENRHETDKPAAPVAVASTKAKAASEKPRAAVSTQKQDSIEVTRTEGDLELAESEFLAEQQELERQLQELQRQRLTMRSGWHYTSLPCE